MTIHFRFIFSNFLQNAMEYVFGSTFVCKTTDTAKEVSISQTLEYVCSDSAFVEDVCRCILISKLFVVIPYLTCILNDDFPLYISGV